MTNTSTSSIVQVWRPHRIRSALGWLGGIAGPTVIGALISALVAGLVAALFQDGETAPPSAAPPSGDGGGDQGPEFLIAVLIISLALAGFAWLILRRRWQRAGHPLPYLALGLLTGVCLVMIGVTALVLI